MNPSHPSLAGQHEASEPPPVSVPHLVRSVDRALRLVDIVAEGPQEGMTLSQISRSLQMSKSSALATARTLVAHGYLRLTEPGTRYKLGMTLIRLGDLTTRQLPLGEICLPILRELAASTGMTARLALADHGHPVFIARNDGPGTVRFFTPLGIREAPHSTAAGKAILSTMTESDVRSVSEENGLPPRTRHTITDVRILLDELTLVRRRGFALDDEEDAEGVFCIGAPFFDPKGHCLGAVSVTGIKVDLPSWKVDALGANLREIADRIPTLIGGQPRPQVPRKSTKGPQPGGKADNPGGRRRET